MTNFKAFVGPKVTSRKQLTKGRFYHLIDNDGEHVVFQWHGSRALVVEHIVPSQRTGLFSYAHGTGCISIGSRLGEHAMGAIYKFTAVPDTTKYRGSRVTSADDLTVGRWYILVDHRGEAYRGEFIRADFLGAALFKLDDESYDRRGWSRSFAVQFGDTHREVYKFTQVTPSVGDEHPPMLAYPEGTRTKDVGAKVGDKFIVVKPSSFFSAGEVVAMVEDDGDDCPYFRGEATGTYAYCLWWRLAPLVPATVAAPAKPTEPSHEQPPVEEDAPQAFDEYTRSGRIGAKVGDPFLVIHPRPGVSSAGDTAILVVDDNSYNPFFDVYRDGVRVAYKRALHWSSLGPVPALAEEPAAPAPEVDPALLAKAMAGAKLIQAARTVGLLANEVERRYETAQAAVHAHTVALTAYENAQKALLELSKAETKDETIPGI